MDIANQIIAIERAALEAWLSGNSSGYLEILADEITYFDPYLPKRMEGLEAMTEFYESLRGSGKNPFTYEMVAPKVQLHGDTAILTYNLDSQAGGRRWLWNCTEVYALLNGAWKIVHNHWSFIRPMDMTF